MQIENKLKYMLDCLDGFFSISRAFFLCCIVDFFICLAIFLLLLAFCVKIANLLDKKLLICLAIFLYHLFHSVSMVSCFMVQTTDNDKDTKRALQLKLI